LRSASSRQAAMKRRPRYKRRRQKGNLYSLRDQVGQQRCGAFVEDVDDVNSRGCFEHFSEQVGKQN
jgi:hypothetical protein